MSLKEKEDGVRRWIMNDWNGKEERLGRRSGKSERRKPGMNGMRK